MTCNVVPFIERGSNILHALAGHWDLRSNFFTPQFCTAGHNLNHYFTVWVEIERENETQKTRPKKAEDGFFYPDGRTDLVRLIKEKCPSVRFVSGGFPPREKMKI